MALALLSRGILRHIELIQNGVIYHTAQKYILLRGQFKFKTKVLRISKKNVITFHLLTFNARAAVIYLRTAYCMIYQLTGANGTMAFLIGFIVSLKEVKEVG